VSNKEKAKEEIKLLVEKYNRVVETGKVKSYNEEMTKKDFILPLFRALGWSVEDGEEVTAEEKISKGRVDYAFRIQSIPKLFLEAKSLKEDLDKIEFAEQAINYAWHKGATWAILTDFEGIKVFNAEWKSSNPLQNMFFSLNCNQFLERFEQLWLLSRESLDSGIIDIEAEKWGKKAKKVPVDKQLLSDLTRFRELLTKNILKNNASKNLSAEELDEAIQRIIDRLIFIRTLEDKQLEAPILQSLIREDCTKRVYKKLNNTFRQIDDIYNSKLFAFHLCEELNIDDDVLEKIIIGLFKTADETVHYDFSAIDADVLGNIYEQYLGYILKKTEKRGKLVEGKAHRKEQGIYYTPTYVVDYIVKNTIGGLAKDKKVDLSKIKVLDPACGSGSFLMKAFDYLVTLDRKKNKDSDQMKLDTSGVSVTYGRKIEILKNNIFGVDLDPKAVEIAQLNLLLKTAEKKHRLPTLQENIKVGNSLIDDPAVSPRAFKWEEQFKEIISNGGFDVVVGNPPYIRFENLKESERKYFFQKFSSAVQKCDIFSFFIEQAINKLSDGGVLGFIVSSSWVSQHSFNKLRKLIAETCIIQQIIITPKKTFKDAAVDTIILILQKSNSKNKIDKHNIIIANILPNGKLENKKQVPQSLYSNSKDYLFNLDWNQKASSIDHHFEKDTKPLGEITNISFGIMTGDDSKFTYNEIKHPQEDKKVLRGGNIKRYGINWSKEWVWYSPSSMKKHKETARPAEPQRFEKEKIIIKREGAGTITASFDEDKYYTIGSTFIVNKKSDDFNLRYILALLNSKLINYWYGQRYKTVTQSINSYQKLPIKIVSLEKQQPLIKLVDKILSLNKRLNELKEKSTDEKAKIEADIKKTDQEIDELVYKIYGITEAEKKIIEESLR
jgi:type I restriction-modification system DNA methylase subunit